jgi:hypothetical protein
MGFWEALGKSFGTRNGRGREAEELGLLRTRFGAVEDIME